MAAIVLTAAAQLLLLAFESSPLIDRDQLEDVTGWIRRRPVVGAGLLAGLALLVGAAGLVLAIGRSFGTDRRVIVTRRREGWTKLDRASLEDAIERRLEAVDRRTDVKARVGRDGRVNLALTTPDPSSTGPMRALREELEELCQERGLPCRVGRVRASTPRRASGRRRVR